MRQSPGVRRSRTGFTLIELLVVIAIIGVLVALIMPAVQAARESANRAKCQNNLKQLGLAAQEYHDNFNSFPAGWYCSLPGVDVNGNATGGDPSCVPYSSTTYMWSGLPGLFLKLEMGNTFNEINFDNATSDVSNLTVVRRSIDAFVCPSNRKAVAVTGASGNAQKLGASDYRGNLAAGQLFPCTPSDPTNNPTCLNFDNGVMYMNSSVSIADITDGTTNTILIGETLTGTWAEASNCCVRTNTDRTVNKPIQFNGQNYYTYWMSKHPNLVNFVKCDGSVQAVTSQIKKPVLNKLMTRNGGEAISSEEIK